MSQDNTSVLLDAKQEYSKQLINSFKQIIYSEIKNIYQESENMCFQENKPENVLMVFQDILSKIPKWSVNKINKSFNKVKTKCDYIDDLIKIIFITHIKILTIVNKNKKNKKIDIKIPGGNCFFHLCLVDAAREIWKSPFLVSKHVSNYEYQKNIREVNKIISESILDTIRKQLPVKNILQDFLDIDIDNSENLTNDNLDKIINKDLSNSEDNIEDNNKNNLKNIKQNNLEKSNENNLEEMKKRRKMKKIYDSNKNKKKKATSNKIRNL